MPLYEYECSACKHRFEIRQGFHDKPEADCPVCQSASRRIFHPTPIIFKGSGFYVTDHRAPMKEPGATTDKTDTPSEKTKTDTESKTSKEETGAGKSTK